MGALSKRPVGMLDLVLVGHEFVACHHSSPLHAIRSHEGVMEEHSAVVSYSSLWEPTFSTMFISLG